MFIKKTDRVSRVVAFITAFAVAMLTVTLIHRTVISAEETHTGMSEAYDDPDTSGSYGESMPSESGAENFVPPGTDGGLAAETPGNIYGDGTIDGVITDNVFAEEVPGIFDGTDIFSEDSGIDLYDNSGGHQITPGKTAYPANDIINPAVCKIYKDGKQELLPGEQVKDGDPLEFDFEWSIPDGIKDPNDPNGANVGFTDKYLEYDITEKINGITLNPGTYSWWTEAEGVKAVYEIRQVPGDDGRIKTLLLIEPRIGFEANSTNRSGSIHLYGKVNLNDFNAGDTNVTLKFIDAEIAVTTSDLDNSITPSKSAKGQPEKRVENGVTKYYQKYQITLKNEGMHDANGVTALDIPGSVLKGKPQNVIVYYSYDWNNRIPLTMNENEPYTFNVGNIKGGGEAYVEYEMEVDTQTALNPTLSSDNLKNKVTVISNPDPDEKTAETCRFVNEALQRFQKTSPKVKKALT